jgi:glycosyltransferase involved in cell wall biosynthesis
MTAKLLSIVTISYNQKRFLREAIDSVLSQKSDDVEYIIVDPGSTDGSLDVIASYGAQIDHVVLGADAGPADGLNKGFAVATGKVGFFLNSDDVLLPKAISVLRNYWSHSPRAASLMCCGWMIDSAGAPLQKFRRLATTFNELLNGGPMFQQGLSFKMEAFFSLGGFNISNRTCWDFELLCDLLHRFGAADQLPDRIGAFRLHGASLTGGAAGHAHQVKYEDDIARLKQKYNFPTSPPTRFSQALKHPSVHIARTMDKIFPHVMRRQFAADCGLK